MVEDRVLCLDVSQRGCYVLQPADLEILIPFGIRDCLNRLSYAAPSHSAEVKAGNSLTFAAYPGRLSLQWFWN